MNRESGVISYRTTILKMVFMIFCGAVTIAAAAGPASAFDSYHLIQNGYIALDKGRTAEAEALFEKYIDSHPATLGENSSRYRKRRQYYIKNLLSVYAELLEIYRKTGNEVKLARKLAQLKATFDNGNFSDKNVYNLAEIYLDFNREENARPLLKQIVENNVVNHYPYNIKAMLRACSKLFDAYKAKGETGAIKKLLATLESNYPDPGFDINDKYSLALLYLENGRTDQGVGLLNEIVAAEPFDFRSPFAHTLTGTYIKLLNISHEKGTPAVRKKLMAQLAAGGAEKMAPASLYRLAVAFLNSGEKEAGRKILDLLSVRYPETVWARKSLFLRARDAMSSKDWNTAIDRYSTYINRYPDRSFFALKAYSSLLDAYWARDGNLEYQNIQVPIFADILNEVADYETQLNLARDLQGKGFDKLAGATFELGIVGARKRLLEPLEDEERLRIHWIIQRYAFPLEKFSVVEDSSREIMDLLNNPAAEKLKSSEKAQFIKSQTYIWLGQTYRKTARIAEAIKTFSAFLTEFQKSSDADFVRFSLAEIYEESGDTSRAKGLYQKIDAGVWKTRAAQKLKKYGLSP